MAETPEQKRLRRMARALDKYLTDLVVKGRPMVDAEGFPVRDANGKPIYKPPSAADLKCIAGRLKDCDVKAGDVAARNATDPQGIGNIVKHMQDLRERGHTLRMAGMAGSDEAEAATG